MTTNDLRKFKIFFLKDDHNPSYQSGEGMYDSYYFAMNGYVQGETVREALEEISSISNGVVRNGNDLLVHKYKELSLREMKIGDIVSLDGSFFIMSNDGFKEMPLNNVYKSKQTYL